MRTENAGGDILEASQTGRKVEDIARPTQPAKLVIAYSHEDEKLRNELDKRLKLLRRQGVLSSWNDREIRAGQDWQNEINENVQKADIILLLISPDFLASDYCIDIEMKAALQRHDRGEALVIPIVLRPVHWQSTPFAKLQALPNNGKPVTTFANRDLAFQDIEAGIRRAVQARGSGSRSLQQQFRSAARKRNQALPVTEQDELRQQQTVQVHAHNASGVTILLADDHTIVRQGLKLILSAHSEFQVIGEAVNGREAVLLADKLKPDIVLLDIAMPELSGIEATRRIVEANPRARVLVLSGHNEATFVRDVLRAGARGYLLKSTLDTELKNALRSVARGDGYISPEVSGVLLSDYRQSLTDPIDLLSSREREVLQLIAEGCTNKHIATSLNLSVYTVDSHRGKIMEKLNLHSTGELVRFAMKHGLVG